MSIIEEVKEFMYKSESFNEYLTPTTIVYFNRLIEELEVAQEIKNALIELVALKDMKDAGVVKQNYLEREPLAWEVARKVISKLEKVNE